MDLPSEFSGDEAQKYEFSLACILMILISTKVEKPPSRVSTGGSRL
jgi:hypothetical protein